VPKNQLGNYIRERRQDLDLTQEELAARIGDTVKQAEVSRLERGAIALPRRARLEALAVALEVTLGSLLMQTGWLTPEEQAQVDRLPVTQLSPDSSAGEVMLTDVAQLRTILLGALERVEALEATLHGFTGSGQRPEVNVPRGVFDDWETSAMFDA
jgi:transcriptional regulator with XRE-family HTH domain